MAQAAIMGPPLSPKEPRRSNRRAPTVPPSHSPDSPLFESALRPKENEPPSSHPRPSLSSSNSSQSSSHQRTNGRRHDEPQQQQQRPPSSGEPTPPPPLSTSAAQARKRKGGKPKERPPPIQVVQPPQTHEPLKAVDGGEPDPDPDAPQQPLEADQDPPSVTRCICGDNGDDDPQKGEFMVQCEQCDVWQHGLCFGYEHEGDLDGMDWYCEMCRPDLHTGNNRKSKQKKRRQSSIQSQRASVPTGSGSRSPRSQSPAVLKKPAKRRNTMNSRDTEETIMALLQATAAEAEAEGGVPAPASTATVPPSPLPPPPASTSVQTNGLSSVEAPQPNGHDAPEEESTSAARRKRKRTDEEARSIKRNRSASTTSEYPLPSLPGREPTPVQQTPSTTKPPPPASEATSSVPPPKPATGRAKRGGGSRAKAVAQEALGVEGGEGATATATPQATARRQGGTARGRANKSDNHRRPHAANGVPSTSAMGSASTSASSRQIPQSSHASRDFQPPLTSWGLPDYLAHMAGLLPSETPASLMVAGGGPDAERGVKVRWPGKRMSVGDMSKRVRSLVEWVGREQASAMGRRRRREALEAVHRRGRRVVDGAVDGNGYVDGPPALAIAVAMEEKASARTGSPMVLDKPPTESPEQEKTLAAATAPALQPDATTTMHMMEQLMQELISFQEKFSRARS